MAVLLFCFLIAEIVTRIYLRQHLVYDVEMSRYSMMFKKVSPDWRIGHEHYPDQQARLMGVWVRTNTDGFRGHECPVERSARKRLIFLGVSLTFGWGVEEKETFSSILESRLSKLAPTEIINTGGTGNYNTEQETYLFLEKGFKYHPDKVVVFYFINDPETDPAQVKFLVPGVFRINIPLLVPYPYPYGKFRLLQEL